VLGTRNEAATGATYMRTSTSRPSPAHQYLTPLDRKATSPYGWTVAIDAYDEIPCSPLIPSPPPRI
jgi:hypothetical protein